MTHPRRRSRQRQVEAFAHRDAKRTNIPTSEDQVALPTEDQRPLAVEFARRHPEHDPQLVWRGKDVAHWSDLIVPAPPLYLQEKVRPKALVDDLIRQSKARRPGDPPEPERLFPDFNGLPEGAERTEFYQHEGNWSNRMILGDGLHVMASLAQREGLRGRVQCIYMDPPYGIRFNSNFQWSTNNREINDGDRKHITRQPEQVRAFRDTWRDGIHSYLTYLRDRMTVARDLLTESGSMFVQISDENLHRVRAVMDEVFGPANFVSLITYRVTSGFPRARAIKRTSDYLAWYARNAECNKFHRLLRPAGINTKTYNQVEEAGGARRGMRPDERSDPSLLPEGARVFQKLPVHSGNAGDGKTRSAFGMPWRVPPSRTWRYSESGMQRLLAANRINPDKTSLRAINFHDDYPAAEIDSTWTDTAPELAKSYVVQTSTKVVERCILMTTDPGDLVLDPTCGSGTTAYAAEQWGRRWIAIDTSRVALALARARIMGAVFPGYLLADSPEGQAKIAEIAGRAISDSPVSHNLRQGFVYRRVPHVTLKSIAHNAEIDVIKERHQPLVDAALNALNDSLKGHATPFLVPIGGRKGQKLDFTAAGTTTLPSGEAAPVGGLMEWEVPRTVPRDWPEPSAAALKRFWRVNADRQKAMNRSIAAKSDFEHLHDAPYVDGSKARVAGPFTVDTLSPHREIGKDENNRPLDPACRQREAHGSSQGFSAVMLEELQAAGIQQMHRDEHISFGQIDSWPGSNIDAVASYTESAADHGNVESGEPSSSERRAAILIGPEFGTVTRVRLVEAAREAADIGVDSLICCAFSYDAQASDMRKYGRIQVVKARMNADLHMPLKSGRRSNLFVVFGEPDIRILECEEDPEMIRVQVKGTDVYDPQKDQFRHHDPKDLACWFIDTDYNLESFFVRHVYFLGASNPYGNSALKDSLKADISREVWESIASDISRPFPRPKTGRIAVKVINQFGDEVLKVMRCDANRG